jgi:hypothetical protein
MYNVTFTEYWNTFFCWAKSDYKNAKQVIKTEARKGYKEYCKSINQEPIWD